MMTDHYQGNVFTEYTALRTQKGKNALTDVKSIRLRQQNVTSSLFGVRASGKKGTQKRFTNHYQTGFHPFLMLIRPGLIAMGLYPNVLGALRVSELMMLRSGEQR